MGPPPQEGKWCEAVAGEGQPAQPVHDALLAGLVPGVTVVPNLFVAISHAQKRGLGYLFID